VMIKPVLPPELRAMIDQVNRQRARTRGRMPQSRAPSVPASPLAAAATRAARADSAHGRYNGEPIR
jgi:hypothetical protein